MQKKQEQRREQGSVWDGGGGVGWEDVERVE